jgi:1,4-alpha-glucan branching enzyme
VTDSDDVVTRTPDEDPATGGPTSAATPAPAPAGPAPIATDLIDRLVYGWYHDPHGILGAHPGPDGVTLRVVRPNARQVTFLLGDVRYPAEHVHSGVFAALVPGDTVPDYRVEVVYEDGFPHLQDDPYRWLPTLGDMDLHLISEGRHEELWRVLGSRVRTFDTLSGPVSGVSFAVWAPNAKSVRVVGDFNNWDGRGHAMRSLGSTGVWEIFIPGIGQGTVYKYEIGCADGVMRQKADPMARHTEHPPRTGSVVYDTSYEWNDADWMEKRRDYDPLNKPMSVYEVHIGSWKADKLYTDMADELVAYVKDTGFTHVEMLPVAEHPFGGSWGYQVTGYFAPTSRYGSPDEFRYLVDKFHQAGIGVILDWVPAHFPKDEWALARFDGLPLYEHPDPRRGDQPDWGTHVFDFGRREVRNFLVANACYWLEEFHIDGLRVDAVASMLYLDYSRKAGEWLPNQYGGRENLDAVQFLQETNATVYKRYPGIVTIAEESTAWPAVSKPTSLGGLGFGFKWNMGWMHDSLSYVEKDPIYRQYHHHQMTFSMMYAYSENFVLPISHDEVVHGKGSLVNKMPGDRWQQFANLRAYLAFMWSHPGKQLLFMGSEFGQSSEWSEARGLDWWLLDQPEHAGVLKLVTELNALYKKTPALWSQDTDPRGFQWIDANDAGANMFSFLRYGDDGSVVACITNFASSPHEGYRIGLPHAGSWVEVLNTDAPGYHGSGVGNLGRVEAYPDGWQGQPASATLRIPPLGALWLVPADDLAAAANDEAAAADPAADAG